MERHDAAIVGAGIEGLIAAIFLARANRRVILLERHPRMGGRAETREFHPGFKASPYADELPAIPSRLFRALDLARHGAILMPAPASVCISDAGVSVTFADETRSERSIAHAARAGLALLRHEVESVRHAIETHAMMVGPATKRRRFALWKRWPRIAAWPGEQFGQSSLDEILKARIPDPALRLHLVSDAISGRAVSPFLAGTALHVLAPATGSSGMAAGALGTIGAALMSLAANAGVVIRCGVEVQAIRSNRNRCVGVLLANGEAISAPAVLSTLDVKRTFLDLVARDALPSSEFTRIGRFRTAGQAARVLIALDRIPDLVLPGSDADIGHGPIHVVSSAQAISRAYDSWREGVLPAEPLVTLRVPSLADPRLAPLRKAVMTATISAVPSRLSEGPWTEARRGQLVKIALVAAERAAPGVSAQVLATQTVVGSDVEATLGLTCGDLDGGELAPDQALSFRPSGDGRPEWTSLWRDGRTPVDGLYLAGPSSAPRPFVSGVAGERAASAMLADWETLSGREPE